MSDVLERLAGPSAVASGTSTVFTGTAAHTYTIKNIRLVNNSAGGVTIKLGIGGIVDGDLILPATLIGAGESGEFDGVLVLSGTETLQANTDSTGITISVSGMDQS